MGIDKFVNIDKFTPIKSHQDLPLIPSSGLAWALNRYLMERAVAAGEPLGEGLPDILICHWLEQALIAGAQDLTAALATRTEVTLNIPAVALGRRGVFTLQQIADAHASARTVSEDIAPLISGIRGWFDGVDSGMALMLAFIMDFDRGRSTGDVASEDSAAAQPAAPPAAPKAVPRSYEEVSRASLESGARKYGIIAVQGSWMWPERDDTHYYLYDLRTGHIHDQQAFDTSLEALRGFVADPRQWIEDGRPVTGKELKR